MKQYLLLLLFLFVPLAYGDTTTFTRINDTRIFQVDTYTPCYGNTTVRIGSPVLITNEYDFPNCSRVDPYKWNCYCNGTQTIFINAVNPLDANISLIIEHYIGENQTYLDQRLINYNNINFYPIFNPPKPQAPPPKPSDVLPIIIVILVILVVILVGGFFIIRRMFKEEKTINKVFIAPKSTEQLEKEYNSIMGKFK